MPDLNTPADAVPAAQTAGADSHSQDFWRDVGTHLAQKDASRNIVMTRANSAAPSTGGGVMRFVGNVKPGALPPATGDTRVYSGGAATPAPAGGDWSVAESATQHQEKVATQLGDFSRKVMSSPLVESRGLLK